MQIDLNLLPSTFDLVHVGLAAALLLFLALQVLLLTVAVLVLLRRRRERRDTAAIASGPSSRDAPEPAESLAKPSAARTEQPPLKESSPDAALQLLGLLQNDARFIDFIQENVAAFSDAEVGAAARVVHEGCRKILRQHFELEPVRSESENSRVTLPKGFDASAVRLTGNIVGDPPFTGTLVHRGWRVSRTKLPKIADGHDTRIIAAAEVEL
jgi:Domain of unknown function (DUF2760)